jgi:membrane protein
MATAQRCEPTSRSTWRELFRAALHPRTLAAALARRIYEDDTFTIAAALAYYFFLSIFPLLLFVLALTSVLPLHGLDAWLLENAAQSLPHEAYVLVERTLHGLLATPRSGLLSVGVALALWSASAAFTALINGLNRAYRAPDPRPWWKVQLYAIGLTVGLSAFLILAFVLTLFGGQVVDLVGRHVGPAAGVTALVVRWTITVAAVLLTVAAIYYACPAVEKDWQWIRPGAVLFTLGFAGTSAAFSYYVGHFASYDATYGSLGAVIILLAWTYILAVFLLLGGELNALVEERIHERNAAEAARTGEEQPEVQLAEEPPARVARY